MAKKARNLTAEYMRNNPPPSPRRKDEVVDPTDSCSTCNQTGKVSYPQADTRPYERNRVCPDCKGGMRERAKRAIYAAFDAIAYDALNAIAEEEGVPAEQASMSREEAIEFVSTCGFVGGYPEMHGNDKEAVRWLEQQPREIQDAILKEAFPHERYSL